MRVVESKQYVISAQFMLERVDDIGAFPFSMPFMQNITGIDFHPSVTFLVGENGSGKSTLLEAIAIASGFNPEGGSKNYNFSSYVSHSDLYKVVRLIRGPKRPRDGFFLRAESYFNLATNIESLDLEPNSGPKIIQAFGGRGLHNQSHGESFVALLEKRLRGNGFYVFDEPEAALSPSRQLWMLSRIDELVRLNSQFIIATHSPILMAYPNAMIYNLGESGLEVIEYEQTEHFKVTRNFLNSHKSFLDKLLLQNRK